MQWCVSLRCRRVCWVGHCAHGVRVGWNLKGGVAEARCGRVKRWWTRCVFNSVSQSHGNLIISRIGILTALTQPSPDALRTAIRETRGLTSKPFGVNITILPTIVPPDYAGFARAAVEEGVRIFETAGSSREWWFR